MGNKEVCFFDWPEAFLAGTETVGGKGWNLARLDRYGFGIPRGGVLSAAVYELFLETNGLKPIVQELAQSVTITNSCEEEVSDQLLVLRERINSGFIPGDIQEQLFAGLKESGLLERPLAVRSSATAEDSAKASFAGVHDSFLNVCGQERLLSAIKGCFASLWTARALAYRRKMNIKDDEVQAAVVIMEMVEAKAAGVGFTCDPRTGRQNILLINANYGLGESVVSGIVEPDEYQLDPKPALPIVIEKRIGTKKGRIVVKEGGGTELVKLEESVGNQVLTDGQITQLSLLMLRVYEALGQGEQHQDVEWVFDGKGFVPVQARPVTVFLRDTYAGIMDQPEVWSNTGYRESNSMVQSTLNWRLAKLHGETLLLSQYKDIGYPLLHGVQYHRLFEGRVYCNIAAGQWIAYDALGIKANDLAKSMFGLSVVLQIKDNNPFRGIVGIIRLKNLIKSFVRNLKIGLNSQKFYAQVNHLTENWQRDGFRTVPDKEFSGLYNKLAGLIEEATVVFSVMMGSAIIPFMILTKELNKHFPDRGNSMLNALMAGNANITSAEHGYRLLEMAELAKSDTELQRFLSAEFDSLSWDEELKDNSLFKQAFHEYLNEFGHRGAGELDIINPRWRENPDYLLQTIRNSANMADLGGLKTQQQKKQQSVWQEIQQKYPVYRRPFLKFWLKRATRGAESREMSKSVLVRVFEIFRMLALELGRRFAERGIIQEQNDIFTVLGRKFSLFYRKLGMEKD